MEFLSHFNGLVLYSEKARTLQTAHVIVFGMNMHQKSQEYSLMNEWHPHYMGNYSVAILGP